MIKTITKNIFKLSYSFIYSYFSSIKIFNHLTTINVLTSYNFKILHRSIIFFNESSSISYSNKFVFIFFFNFFNLINNVLNIFFAFRIFFNICFIFIAVIKEPLVHKTSTNRFICKKFFKHIKITRMSCTKSHFGNIRFHKFISSNLLFSFRYKKLRFTFFICVKYIFTRINLVKFSFIICKLNSSIPYFRNTSFIFRKFIKFPPRTFFFSFVSSFRFISNSISNLTNFTTACLEHYSTHNTPKSSIPKFRICHIRTKTTTEITFFFASKKSSAIVNSFFRSNCIYSFFDTFSSLSYKKSACAISKIFKFFTCSFFPRPFSFSSFSFCFTTKFHSIYLSTTYSSRSSISIFYSFPSITKTIHLDNIKCYINPVHRKCFICCSTCYMFSNSVTIINIYILII